MTRAAKLFSNVSTYEPPDICPDCKGPSRDVRNRWGTQWERQRCASCAQEHQWREADAARDRRVALALDSLNVTAMYQDATLDNFQLHGTESDKQTQSRVLRHARRYVSDWPDDVPMIVVMAGGYGTGKGHIAWAILRELALTYLVTGRFTVLSDLVRDLRKSWRGEEDVQSEAQTLMAYRLLPLLVVDEVSRHAFYGEPRQHLYDLVAWREQRKLPTILTTNEKAEEVPDVVGPALASRALGWGMIWNFGDKDYRLVQRTRGGAA